MNEILNRGVAIGHKVVRPRNQARTETQRINSMDYIVVLLGFGSVLLSWLLILGSWFLIRMYL